MLSGVPSCSLTPGKNSCLLTQFMLSGAPSCQFTSFHVYWRAFMPLTRFHAHWHAFMAAYTDTCPLTRPHALWRAFMPTDTSTCPLTCFHVHWHAFTPTDTFLCSLTCLHALWRLFMPTDEISRSLTLTERSSCPHTRLFAEWQPFMHKIIRIMCIDSDNNVWWKLRKISKFFAPAALKKCRFGGLMLLYSWYLYLLYR